MSALLTALLDVNVLIALAWPNHVHHVPAMEWFHRRSPAGWATCPPTQAGFVRVSSNRAAIPEARSPADCREMLRRILDLPGHEFWTDDIEVASTDLIDDMRVLGHRQVPDAHLIAIAIRNEGTIATLDRGVLELVPRGHDPDAVVELLVGRV